MQVPSENREVLTPPRKKVKGEVDELIKGIRKVPPAKFPSMMGDTGRLVPVKVLSGKAASTSQARASRVRIAAWSRSGQTISTKTDEHDKIEVAVCSTGQRRRCCGCVVFPC